MQAFRMLLLSCALAVAAAFVAPAGQAALCPSFARQAAVSMTAATKPQRTNERRRAYNKMYKSEMRTMIKKVEKSVATGDYALAAPALSRAFSIIDKNVKRNIVHKNTAARKKSQLTLKVKALEPAP